MSATMSGFGPYLYRSNDPEQLRAELATLTAERDAAMAEVSRLRKTVDEAVWNDPTTKDALRAELAAAQAEIERLRKSLALVDDALSSYAEFYWRAAGLAGLPDDALPSTQTDNIILSKIAEHDEIERLRGAFIELIHRVNVWGSKTAGQSLPVELSDAIFQADLAVTQKQEGGAQ